MRISKLLAVTVVVALVILAGMLLGWLTGHQTATAETLLIWAVLENLRETWRGRERQ